jgi:hypothetical protein
VKLFELRELRPVPEITSCWECIAKVLPPSDPSDPKDPSVNLDTLVAIAHAKWHSNEIAEQEQDALARLVEELGEALKRIEYGVEVDWALGVDENCERLRDVARVALAKLEELGKQ